MALKVPQPQQVDSIKKFVELPDEAIEEFLEAISKAGPQFNVFDLIHEASGRLNLPKELTSGIVGVLAGLYLTWERQGTRVETFLDQEVLVTLQKAKVFSSEPDVADSQWLKLRRFLARALSLENTLGTAAKAGNVLTQHERIFNEARILTDVCPIFHRSVIEKPESAVLIHMLRVAYRDWSGKNSETYFALDSNDIRAIRDVLDRAIKKEETLRQLMKEAGVTVLHPKEFF